MYHKRMVFAVACLNILVFGIGVISLGAILPFLSDKFGLDEISKGTLASLLPLGILTGSLVFGPIVDKYSYKNLLSFSVVLNILGLELIAWSNSFVLLGLAFFLIGWGGGMINGATSALVSDISEDHGENKGANLSILGVFFGLGALGMPIVIGSLSDSFGTEANIAGIGIFMVIPLLFNLFISFPEPKQSQAIALKSFFALVRNKMLLLFGFVLFFQAGMESLTNNWTTTYLIEKLDVAENEALFSLTLYVGIFTLGRLLLGFLLKRFSSHSVIIVSILLATVGGILTYISKDLMMYQLSLVLIGLGLAGGFPIVLGMVGDQFPSWSGTAFGVVFSIALFGNMTINYFTGLIAESRTIIVFPVIYLLSAIMMSILLIIALGKRK